MSDITSKGKQMLYFQTTMKLLRQTCNAHRGGICWPDNGWLKRGGLV